MIVEIVIEIVIEIAPARWGVSPSDFLNHGCAFKFTFNGC